MWRKLLYLIAICFLFLSNLPVVFGTGGYTNPIPTSVQFQDIVDSTYVQWVAPLYTNAVYPGGKCQCFNATGVGFASNMQSQNLAIRASKANLTIYAIGTASISVETLSNASSTPTIYYFNTTDYSSMFGINSGTQLPLSFIPTASFSGCSAPCMAFNSTNGAIQVKGLSGNSNQLTFFNANHPNANSSNCIAFQTATNGVMNAFEFMPIVLLLAAAAGVMGVLGGLQLKAKEETGGSILLPMAFFIAAGVIVLVLGAYVAGYIQALGNSGLGC